MIECLITTVCNHHGPAHGPYTSISTAVVYRSTEADVEALRKALHEQRKVGLYHELTVLGTVFTGAHTK